MLYKVTTARETIHSIVYKHYSNLNMLNTILVLNRNLDTVFLNIGDTVYLPEKTLNIQQREKLY